MLNIVLTFLRCIESNERIIVKDCYNKIQLKKILWVPSQTRKKMIFKNNSLKLILACIYSSIPKFLLTFAKTKWLKYWKYLH